MSLRAPTSPWLVGARFDLLAFGLPALVALALVPLGPWLAPRGETPFPMWIIAILLVDVAHVWSTLYRTYLDGHELRRRPLLYTVAPLAAFAGAWLLLRISVGVFWTALAYLAVFHFVRQQYGWVSLYRRKDPGATVWDLRIDTAAIYLATLFPLLWWHANLPRRFHWFMPGDFFSGLPVEAVVIVAPAYVAALLVYLLRQIQRYRREGYVAHGKNLVVLSTVLCWGVGIIATNTDWAFTVTNVLIHGVPYLAIVWHYGRRKADDYPRGSFLSTVFRRGGWPVFFLVVAFLAFCEELAWNTFVWHEARWLWFLSPVDLAASTQSLAVALLVVPQTTHYLLDGWIWRSHPRANPDLGRRMALLPTPASASRT